MIRQIFSTFLCCLGLVQAATKPNIVVIFTDDQAHNAIGYDNPEVLTPHLDALAASGVIFNRAYAASPICAASRASAMTGLFPQQNGSVGLDTKPFHQQYWKGGEKASRTLASMLSKAGYHTAAYGKSHLGEPVNFGFDEGAETETNAYDDVAAFARMENFFTKRAAANKPFFLWLAPRQPHLPLIPAKKWFDLYTPGQLKLPPNFRESPLAQSINNQGVPKQHYYRDSKYVWNINKLPSGPPRDRPTMQRFLQAYYAVVSHLDHQIGTMIGQMKKAGVWDNTVLIFISDNGYHLGSHGLGNKITMHEESVRVPMFATGPSIARGKRTKSLVSSLDLYPTLLTLAGAEVPKWAMGRSLTPVFENPNTTVRQTVFSECVGVGGKAGEGHRMASDGRYKLILTGTDELYLFDHSKDPAELTNVIDNPEYAKVRKRLESELTQWMHRIGDRSAPFPVSPRHQRAGKPRE